MKIAIVDDDMKVRKQIFNFLNEFNKENCISKCMIYEFNSGEALLERYAASCDLDILFIDIEMNQINGIEAVKQLHKISKSLIIIFITNHVDYAEDMFRVGAFRLLLKPINEATFRKDYYNAIEEFTVKNKQFAIKSFGSKAVFAHKDIYYIESIDRYLYLYTQDKQYKFSGKISEVESDLESIDFVRCHKGYIVNMNCIIKININDIEIENHKLIPLSKHRRANVLNKYSLFLRRR